MYSFPYSREMVIVVFGDKIQMVYESHRRFQALGTSLRFPYSSR
jgi:hypothetical protein